MVDKEFDFNPLNTISEIYAPGTPRCEFAATNADEAKEWQRKTRAVLSESIGFQDRKRIFPNPKVINRAERDAFVREKIVIQTTEYDRMPVYVLTPKEEQKPYPCVIALSGHGTPEGNGYGAKDVVGLFKDGSERYDPEPLNNATDYHADFGCELAKQGFIVVAPEVCGFGERNPNFNPNNPRRDGSGCPELFFHATLLGGSVVGLRVWDNMRLIDYLETLEHVDHSRIGIMGIDGGGTSFFTAALDLRIKACVISGYFCEWEGSILAQRHCMCNYIPGIMRIGRLSDLSGLIAPRPCLVEHGIKDSIFPIEYVREAVNSARKVWGVFGAADKLENVFFEGGHRIHGIEAYDFFKRHLKAHSQRQSKGGEAGVR